MSRVFALSTRIRNSLLIAVAALGLALCGGATSSSPISGTAVAGHPTYPQYRYYYVYYRTCAHDTWHYYGATIYPAQASAAIVSLRQMGYEVVWR